MRIGIAIDVSTDVSRRFEHANGVHVLPSTLHLDGRSVVYDRDPELAMAFYRAGLASGHPDAETTPFTTEEIEELFLERLALDYDYVFVITMMGSRSRTYENAHRASLSILRRCQGIRAARGIEGPFAMHVLDSQSFFTGPGVLAWEAARMVRERRSPGDIRKRLTGLVPRIHAYLVPDDLWYVRVRGRRRGDRSISLPAYVLARMLDIKAVIHANCGATSRAAKARGFGLCASRLFARAAARIRAGLEVSVVALSYAGDPAQVRSLPGYGELEDAAGECDVEVMISMMSPAGAVNVGSGAVTLAYCAAQPLVFD